MRGRSPSSFHIVVAVNVEQIHLEDGESEDVGPVAILPSDSINGEGGSDAHGQSEEGVVVGGGARGLHAGGADSGLVGGARPLTRFARRVENMRRLARLARVDDGWAARACGARDREVADGLCMLHGKR